MPSTARVALTRLWGDWGSAIRPDSRIPTHPGGDVPDLHVLQEACTLTRDQATIYARIQPTTTNPAFASRSTRDPLSRKRPDGGVEFSDSSAYGDQVDGAGRPRGPDRDPAVFAYTRDGPNQEEQDRAPAGGL